jgi:predicted nucleic acid-binding protein
LTGTYVLDSGGVSFFARRDREAAARMVLIRSTGSPVVVPSAVLIECLTGKPGRDAAANRLLKTCVVVVSLAEVLARRAARLRTRAARGSAVDALVVASAEPGGHVVTSGAPDIGALAAHATGVTVIAV